MGWSPLHTLSMEANKYCPAICYCSLLSSFYRSLGSTLSRDRVSGRLCLNAPFVVDRVISAGALLLNGALLRTHCRLWRWQGRPDK